MLLKNPKKKAQRALNHIGRLKYFHDEKFDKRRNQLRKLMVESSNIAIKNLPDALEGFSIVQLTDLHLRPFTQLELIERAVVKANLLKPDLVVLTGDYVWHDEADILDLAPVLAQLKAKYGVYACLGNHDVDTDAKFITEVLHRHKIPVLINQGFSFEVGDARLYLAGIDDGWKGQPDIKATMNNHPNKGNVPTILLAHEPDMIDWYADDTRISLQLSGHTHGGGQVVSNKGKSFIKAHLGKKYVKGLYRVNQSWVYTSRGIGSTGLPVRHNCLPEVTHLRLVKEESST